MCKPNKPSPFEVDFGKCRFTAIEKRQIACQSFHLCFKSLLSSEREENCSSPFPVTGLKAQRGNMTLLILHICSGTVTGFQQEQSTLGSRCFSERGGGVSKSEVTQVPMGLWEWKARKAWAAKLRKGHCEDKEAPMGEKRTPGRSKAQRRVKGKTGGDVFGLQ